MTSIVRTVQQWFKPLQNTFLHPQFLVLRHRQYTAMWINKHAHGTLIDIGCGNGALRKQLPATVQYFGVDYPTTIALGYTGYAEIHADASMLPLATASVDTVAMLDVLEHIAEPENALAEASRVLKKRGKLLVHVPFLYPLHDEPYDYHRWTKYGLQYLAKQHGLEIIEIRESTSSLETAAAIFVIALSKASLDSIMQRKIILVITPLILLMIPIINIVGWLLGRLMPESGFMPFSYRVTLKKLATGK